MLGVFLNGAEIPTPGPHGEPMDDDSFLVLFNAHFEDRSSCCRGAFGRRWTLELSTAEPRAEPGSERYGARTEVPVSTRSIVVLKRVA